MAGLQALATAVKKTLQKGNADIVYDPKKVVDFISSGNIVFDAVSGGGFPRGRISEVFGMEHSCKTAITLETLAGVQKAKGVGVFMDHETAWHAPYAEKTYGLVQDNETFMVFQPDNLEEGDIIVDELMKIDKLDIVVFDSVDAMRPKAAIESVQAEGDRRVGSHAMGMGRIVAKLRILAKKKNCAVVMINQMRTTINTNKGEQNVGTGAGFNVMETHTTTGGHALRFYASLRIKMEYGGQINDELMANPVDGDEKGKTRIGNSIKVINIKNKVSTPFLKGLTAFYFPGIPGHGKDGWNKGRDMMELLRKRGRIRQGGTKFIYNGLNIPEWSNIASKVASEEKWLNDAACQADAEALLKSLMVSEDDKAATLDIAVVGQDFSEDEIKEVEPAPVDLGTLGVVSPNDTHGHDDGSNNPVEEITI